MNFFIAKGKHNLTESVQADFISLVVKNLELNDILYFL